MLSEKIKKRLELKLQNTRLRQLIAGEIVALLAEKPDTVNTEEYCMAAAELVVGELKAKLCRPFEKQPLDSDETESAGATGSGSPSAQLMVPDEKATNLDAVLKRLTTGVDRALLDGNLQMLRALGEAIAQRDTGTARHSPRVTLLSVALAEHLELDTDKIQAIIKGSFLHDIGKIGISDDILLKPRGLTDEERAIMNSHPRLGAMIISSVSWLADALDIVRYHHERWDGSGYPDGLKHVAIPLNARIFAVVDVFDALASERPYKEAMVFHEVRDMILAERGKHFDPSIVDAFDQIARHLYDSYMGEPYHVLDAMVRHSMETHFGASTPIPL